MNFKCDLLHWLPQLKMSHSMSKLMKFNAQPLIHIFCSFLFCKHAEGTCYGVESILSDGKITIFVFSAQNRKNMVVLYYKFAH